MKTNTSKLTDALLSLSLANLCFIKVWFELLHRNPTGYYFTETPPTPYNIYGTIINVLVMASLVFACTCFMRRFSGKWADVFSKTILLTLFAIPLNGIRMQFWGVALNKFGKGESKVFLALFVVAIIFMILGQRRTYSAVRMVILILCPFVIFTFWQAIAIAHDPHISGTLQDKKTAAPVSQIPPKHRVVILLYDEMDFRITFVDRPAKLTLPEIDRLKSESFFATDAHSPSDSTITSVPALMIGKKIIDAQPLWTNDLMLKFEDRSQAAWSKQPNIFTQAREAGLDSALIGVYHPYSRVIGGDTTYCANYPPANMGLGESIMRLWRRSTPFYTRQQHMDRYHFAQKEALKVASDPRFGLVFVHFPIPHGPSIYDARKDEFTLFGDTVTDNVDNLKLVDHSLGEIRRAMENTGVWNKTTVILTADHWWRTSKNYDGKVDHRIPFMIKYANEQNKLTKLDNSLNTVLLKNLLCNIEGVAKK